jgi:translation initiation factor 1 (eIF-1/SUI1)
MAKKSVVSSGPEAENPFAAALSQALGGYTPDPNSATGMNEEQVAVGEALRGWVHIGYEKKGRAGKTVTTLEFVDFDAVDGGREAAAQWVKKLKTQCGVGGSVDGNWALLQGDVRPAVEAQLKKWGFRTKRIGG